MRIVHGQQNQRICHICAKVYKSPASLRHHLKEHSGIEQPRVTCEKCGRSCRNEITLRQHLTIHEDEGKPFPCTECTKVYSHRMALAAHIRGTHKFKLLKCHLCEKEFKRPITLKVCPIHIQNAGGKSNEVFRCPCRSTSPHTPGHFYTIAIIARRSSNALPFCTRITRSTIPLNGVPIDTNQHENKRNEEQMVSKPNAFF